MLVDGRLARTVHRGPESVHDFSGLLPDAAERPADLYAQARFLQGLTGGAGLQLLIVLNQSLGNPEQRPPKAGTARVYQTAPRCGPRLLASRGNQLRREAYLNQRLVGSAPGLALHPLGLTFPLLWCKGAERQSVDFGFHGLPEGGVDHALARDQIVCAKAIRNDQHAEMSAALGGAGVAGVQRALVDDLEVLRCERLPQAGFIRLRRSMLAVVSGTEAIAKTGAGTRHWSWRVRKEPP